MKFGIIRLVSMVGNLALQALEKRHEVVGSSRSEKPQLAGAGVTYASLRMLDPPSARREGKRSRDQVVGRGEGVVQS